MGKQWKQWLTLFFGAPKSLQMVIAAIKLKDTYSLEGKLWPTWTAYSKAETLLCQQRYVVKAIVSNGHVLMWELDCEDSWVLKNWCFWTVVLEKTLESPLDCKEIQRVHSEGDQSWVFFARTDVEGQTSNFAHLMRRVDSFEKTLMLGKFEGRRRRGQQRMRWLDGITNLMDMGLG